MRAALLIGIFTLVLGCKLRLGHDDGLGQASVLRAAQECRCDDEACWRTAANEQARDGVKCVIASMLAGIGGPLAQRAAKTTECAGAGGITVDALYSRLFSCWDLQDATVDALSECIAGSTESAATLRSCLVANEPVSLATALGFVGCGVIASEEERVRTNNGVCSYGELARVAAPR